jgi:hypothetical protein
LGGLRVLGRIALAFGTKQRWGWRAAPLVQPFIDSPVPFAVVGGVALSYYTDGRTTPDDLDLVLSPSPEWATAVFIVLKRLIERGVANGPREFSIAAIREGGEMKFKTFHGELHILGRSAGSDGEGIVSRRRWVWLDRTAIPLCDVGDLIALKERDRRPKDLQDLELLKGVIVPR